MWPSERRALQLDAEPAYGAAASAAGASEQQPSAEESIRDLSNQLVEEVLNVTGLFGGSIDSLLDEAKMTTTLVRLSDFFLVAENAKKITLLWMELLYGYMLVDRSSRIARNVGHFTLATTALPFFRTLGAVVPTLLRALGQEPSAETCERIDPLYVTLAVNAVSAALIYRFTTYMVDVALRRKTDAFTDAASDATRRATNQAGEVRCVPHGVCHAVVRGVLYMLILSGVPGKQDTETTRAVANRLRLCSQENDGRADRYWIAYGMLLVVGSYAIRGADEAMRPSPQDVVNQPTRPEASAVERAQQTIARHPWASTIAGATVADAAAREAHYAIEESLQTPIAFHGGAQRYLPYAIARVAEAFVPGWEHYASLAAHAVVQPASSHDYIDTQLLLSSVLATQDRWIQSRSARAALFDLVNSVDPGTPLPAVAYRASTGEVVDLSSAPEGAPQRLPRPPRPPRRPSRSPARSLPAAQAPNVDLPALPSGTPENDTVTMARDAYVQLRALVVRMIERLPP